MEIMKTKKKFIHFITSKENSGKSIIFDECELFNYKCDIIDKTRKCQVCGNILFNAGDLIDGREVLYCKVCKFRGTFVKGEIMKKLQNKKYKIIYADPAWVYDDKALSGNRGAGCKYKLSPMQEMEQMNINADDNSVCLMWCTYPQLENGLKLMKAWGFKFKTVAFTWVKKNKVSDSFFMGMGRHTRGNPEIVLLGIKGKGVPRINCGVRNLQIRRIREHSRKPDEIREEIIKLYGDLPRIELFARTQVKGWDVVGNETDKFKEV